VNDEQPPPPPAAPAAARASGQARPWLTALGMATPLAWVAAVALLLALALAATLHVLLQREAGTRWLLQQLPGVSVQGWQGALLGGRWQAERLVVSWDQGRARAELLLTAAALLREAGAIRVLPLVLHQQP